MSGIVLTSGGASLEIAHVGAEARRWRVGKVDLLWPGDAQVWDEISPILFPIVGWTRDGIRVGGRRYDLGLHGFARRLTFDVSQQGADFARLSVRDDEATRTVYPFAFTLAVEYRLTPTALNVTLEVGNSGDVAMPYACGLHPGFNWPFGGAPRAGARAVFAELERAEVAVIAPGGLFSGETRPVPLEDGRILPLDDALFAREALCFLNTTSRSLRFEQADGSALEMTLHGFAHIALWTRPPARFLSLEAWTGFGDPVNFAGELHEKPSIRVLAPGEKAEAGAAFQFHASRSS